MPGQNASSGSIPQNRARLPFPAPNLQALSAQPKGKEKNNRDTEILLIPLSLRKQRSEPPNNRDTEGYPAESKRARSEPRGEPQGGSLEGGIPTGKP